MASQITTPPMNLPAAGDACWCGSGRKYKRCHKPLEGRVLPGVVSPMRSVPDHIVKPPYAASGKVSRQPESAIKTPDVIERMRIAGSAAAEVLALAGNFVKPGITTDAIDAYVHELCLERGAYPSPLNYSGYPKSVCTSVNEVICHGIPDTRPLQDGDIVNIDVTIFIHGMHGDCSATVAIGQVDDASRRLMEVTHDCMMLGIKQVRPGGRIRDIGKAIESHATGLGYGVVRAFVGHGLGELFHMDPQVPHYYDPAADFAMLPGHTFTVEPMINQGTWKHQSWNDNWTAVTADLKRSAQYEHTVLVTERGVEILTLREGESQPFPG